MYNTNYTFEECKPDGLVVNHSFVFGFERRYNYDYVWEKANENYNLIFYALASYVTMILVLKRFMRDRPPYELKVPLFIWNMALSIFSFWGAYRVGTETIAIYNKLGFDGTLCHNGAHFGVAGLWVMASVFSKPIEFGDTAFLILRKRPLIFLHWYHHLETAYVCWRGFSIRPAAIARWFVLANFSVHAPMYLYYALSPYVKIPKPIAMAITSLQTFQMFFSLIAIVRTFMINDCPGYPHEGTHMSTLVLMSFNYGIYLYLFCKFFYESYISKSLKRQKAEYLKLNAKLKDN